MKKLLSAFLSLVFTMAIVSSCTSPEDEFMEEVNAQFEAAAENEVAIETTGNGNEDEGDPNN